jgi:hypothetical protein
VLSLLTKGIVKSINRNGNRCIVELPLFQTASDPTPVELEATINITPGLFNNLFINDVVFVAFEENALEQPVVLGKLFKGTASENKTNGGAAILDTLRVNSSATLPASTIFDFSTPNLSEYKDLSTPKKIADYIKWLEAVTKNLLSQSDEHFRCFKNWTQWQLNSENVEIDDGDLDTGYHIAENLQYQSENTVCNICGDKCTKNKIRTYLKSDLDKTYPNI